MRKFIDKLLKNKYFEYFLIVLIVFNIICLGFETDKMILLRYKSFFSYVEIYSVAIFSIEYVLRIFSIKSYKELFTPLMLIDLLAILPFYLPLKSLDLRILRIFRLFRILRIFKLARYFEALQVIGKVIYKKRIELISIFGILLFLMFISSFLMYYAENEAQPDVFSNIIDTFWWSIVTFTTVGYGDIYPVTVVGKFISGITVLLGIGLFALPTSILTAEFLNIFQKEKNK